MADYISQITLPNNKTYDLKDAAALPKSGGTMTGHLKFSGNNSRDLTWEDGTWYQRILTTDDSTADTAVFTFQQTSDSGSNWTDLFTIKDNGTVIATTFKGKLQTNYINQTALTGTCEITGGDKGANADPRYLPEKWKFNANITVTDGDIITIKTPGAGHDYGTYLSLDNGANYYPIVLNTTGRYTTHFSTGTAITLRFDSSGSATSMFALSGQNNTTRVTVSGGVWRLLTVYDSGNSNDTGTLIRDYGGNVAIVTTTAALYRYELMLSITDTNYGWKAVPINTTSNTQGTGKTTIYTGEFNPFGEIYYYSHTDTVNSNTTVRADRIWKTYPVNIKYSFNCGDTLTASKDVYIVATMQSATTAKLRNPTATGDNAKATATGANAGPITQTLPTTNDGFIYIRLGRAYSSNSVDISIDHPIYYHDGTSIRRLSPINTIGTSKGDMMYWSAANIPKRLAIGTVGYLLQATENGPSWVDWRKHIFANKNESRTTLTVTNSTWAVTSGTDVFGLSFKDTGLTYTPSGGSATASSDTGDWRAWLTCAAATNTVNLNMRIDGTWQASKFIGPLQGNADTATAWANARKVYVALGTASKTTTINGSSASDAAAIALGIDGTLGIGHGGTNATTAQSAIKNLFTDSTVTVASGDFTDNTVMITSDNSGSTANWYQRAGIKIWNYIKGKADVTYAGINALAVADALIYKGVYAGAATTDNNAYGALTPAANCGDTYKVSVAGFINGLHVEVGDMLICTTDNTEAATASNYTTIRDNWNIIQTSEGSVSTSFTSSTDNAIVRWDGTSGRIIQNSGITIDDNGNLVIAHATNATMTTASTNPQIIFSENGGQPVHLIYTDYDTYRNPAGLKIIGGTAATPAWLEVEGSIYAAKHYGSIIPSSWLDGQRYQNSAYNINDYSNTSSYNPWMRATNTWSSGAENEKVGRWFSFGTLGASFYWMGSTTTRTENSYDHALRYDTSNGYLHASAFKGNADTATSAGKWTTARTLTIGNKGQSVDGSGNVSWSLSDIGAAPAVDGGYLPLSGGTMTGRIKTSFKSSIAMGSYVSAQTTIPNLLEEIRYSSGCAGSFNLTTAYTLNNITLATGWYNFMYIPHRSGGINGAASGDNCNYGVLYLHRMNASEYSDYILSYSSSTITLLDLHASFQSSITDGQVLISDGTLGHIKTSGYTIAKSVPSDAKFTDTTYTIATGDSNGQIKVTPSSGSAYNINVKGFESGYINTHPENSPVLIPFIHNDIAFLTKRGGSVSSTYDGNAMSYNFENCFDGSGSYFSVSSSTYSTLIITLTLHKTFTWTNTIYIDFGASGWRAKNIQIEVMNSNYANDTWASKANVTNNGSGHYHITMTHTPSGASNAGGGFNKIRFTLSSWNSTDRRISQIGIYNYGSIGARETYMSRGIDDAVYRSITPANNNTYDLGSSTAKWANIYATTFTGDITGNANTATAIQTAGTTAQFYRGDNSWSNTLVGPLYVNDSTDAEGTNDAGALIVGNKAGANVAIDDNEIMARNNKATSTLYINNNGGLVSIGSGGMSTSGKITSTLVGAAAQFGNNSVLNVTDNASASNRTVDIKGRLNLYRTTDNSFGRISFYSNSYTTWITYMSNVSNGLAPTGGKPSSLGNVTAWAMRSLIEHNNNYGWLWEACANGAASANTVEPTARMALSSYTGQLRIAPNASSTALESAGLIIDGAKNASSGNVALELWRGGNASWQIANEGGNLYFRNNWTTAKQSTYTQTAVIIAYNTGNTTFAGKVTATGGFSGALTGDVTGDLTGTATNVTTTADTTNTMYLVGVKSGATTTLLHDTSITAKADILTVGKLTITGGTTNSSMTSSGTLTISNSTKNLSLSTTTAALTISTTDGALEAKSTGTGTVKLTGTSGAMTISTTTGALTIQTNSSTSNTGNMIIQTAGTQGTITLESKGASVSIKSKTSTEINATTSLSLSSTTSTSLAATTTMSITSTTSTSISATTTMSISGTQGTSINSGSNYTIAFKINNVEKGQFNKNGMFQLNDTGTQDQYKLYVNGDSAFNGKIAIGEQVSNVITEKVHMAWNETDKSLDFIFA